MKRGLCMAWLRLAPGILRALGVTAMLLGAASCGQTGPLTLPGRAPSPSTSTITNTAPPADADEAEDDESESDAR